jgi:hypothetical protein
VIILAAGFYGIRTSARLGTILGTTEIAVFLVLAVFFVVHAGHANTAAVFTTKYTPKGFHGVSGVIGGSVYSVLAFGGGPRAPRRARTGACRGYTRLTTVWLSAIVAPPGRPAARVAVTDSKA